MKAKQSPSAKGSQLSSKELMQKELNAKLKQLREKKDSIQQKRLA